MGVARLASLIVLITSVCAAAIGLARWRGSADPPTLAGVFTAPDGGACERPCLFGIYPGVTSAEQAAEALLTHPLTRTLTLVNRQPFRLEGKAEHIVMVSFNATPAGTVDEVTLASYVRYGVSTPQAGPPLPNSGTLGDMLARFGTPNFIQITNGGDPMLAFFDPDGAPQGGYLASLIRNRTVNRHIVPRMPLSRLTLFHYQPCSDSAFLYVFPQWQGLAGFRRYARGKTLDTMVRRMDSQGATFAPCQVGSERSEGSTPASALDPARREGSPQASPP
jgi:hypothetical protein